MNEPQNLHVNAGSHGAYEWLVTEQSLDDLLERCPEIVLGMHIAVTSFDSGSLNLSDEEKASGWESRGGIAYSPKIQNIETLPYDCYDEWYVFEDQVDLGRLDSQHLNVFEAPLTKGNVHVFVNFGGVRLDSTEMVSINELFWRQFDWIHPRTFIADGNGYMTIVSGDKDLFLIVKQTLSGRCS